MNGMKNSTYVERDTAVGLVTHEISEDGQILISRFVRDNGETVEGSVGWKHPEVADEHREKTMRYFEETVLPAKLAEIGDLPPGTTDHSRFKRLYESDRGTLCRFINIGPPTWWLPSVRFKRYVSDSGDQYTDIGVGWLRICVQLVWRAKR